jgi:hypothetical protein
VFPYDCEEIAIWTLLAGLGENALGHEGPSSKRIRPGPNRDIFAFQASGVKPDVVAIAKPIAAGLPLGASA